VSSLLVAAVAAIAQDGPPRGGPGQGQGPGGGPPPPPPLVAALDANHDGVIDSQEIDNAAAALRTLDKNKDGKLTQDEFRPPRREGGPGGQGGQGGPGEGGGGRPPGDGRYRKDASERGPSFQNQ